MAEFILAVVGIGIAIPGVAVSLAQCGEYINNLANRFINAPFAIRQIATFGHNLHQGKLKVDLELFEAIWSAPDVDGIIKTSIEDIINQLKLSLMSVAATLNSFLDKTGNVRRASFVLFGERRCAIALKDLKNWQSEFESLLDLIDKKRRLVPNQLLLSRDRFRVIHDAARQDYSPVEGTNGFVVKAEYKNQGIHELQCLVERRSVAANEDSDDARAVAIILASKLSTNTSNSGVLQCLGYRESPVFELIFRLPPNTTNVQNLATAIKSYEFPLEFRLRLCHEMCEAVLRVHTSDLVHKNIRTASVLLVDHGATTSKTGTKSSNAQPLSTIFLSDWSMLRRVTDLSSRRGTNDWKQDIFRHPRRQGRQPEERYHLGHDIYSLGVVLIEIALWETLIQPTEAPPISVLFRRTAARMSLVSNADITRLDKLTMPLTVQKALIGIAQTEVASRSSSAVADFVVACLTCLEGGMLGLQEQDFKNASTEVVLRFRELFLRTFA